MKAPDGPCGPVRKCKGICSMSAHFRSLLQWWGRFHTLRLIKPPQATFHVSLVVRPGQWASTDLLNPHPAQLLPEDRRVRAGGPRHGTKGRWSRGWALGTRRTRWERALPDLGLPPGSQGGRGHRGSVLPCNLSRCWASRPLCSPFGFNQNSHPTWLVSHHPHIPPQLFVI